MLGNKDKTFSSTENTKYLLETILFDDIVPFLSKNKNYKPYEKALMKIDIGFEPYAFQSAQFLFEKIDIPIVFMEWENLPGQTEAVILL